MKRNVFHIILIFVTLIITGSCSKEESSEQQPDIRPPAKSNTVLMVVTSNNQLKDGSPAGYFLPEAIDFYKVLKSSGYQVVVASPKGGLAPMYQRNQYIMMYQNELDSSDLLSKLDQTVSLSTIKAEDYAAVFYVGGFACLFDYPDHADIKRITAGIYEKGGVVAAVCHAPAALLNVTLSNGSRLITNKQLTARSVAEETSGGQVPKDYLLQVFPFILEDELKTKGALYSNKEIGKAHVIADGRLVTGQNPESSTGVAQKAIELLSKP